jgi:3alpha(or 20beta)-hydroxysteroid dehydrogenase
MSVIYPTGTRLAGKVALISGGARGMGESHARAMVAQGARVVIGDLLDAEGAQLAAELGSACTYVHLDVTDRDQWAGAVQTALERYGKLNVLVNNAGIANFAPIGQYTAQQWDTIIAINLTGVFNGINASVEALKASAPSSIINISSTAGLQGYSALPGYNAAKFGVRGLTKSVALDLGIHNVRCNSVHPGAVATPMTAGLDTAQRHVALRRIGRSEELSALIVFLASDESSYSTGSEFVADGGETAGLAPGALGS